ncbi:MAG: 50S ribosomal protein L25 [Candidatus Nomurabacteria bacterium]|jgi:large subunit ribosomal protein L25|nr:50S ribosomal protein L25 [Candidatus Nomurabacteria bacterium]
MSEKLALQKRDVSGKKVKALRRQGLVTSVVYGRGITPILTQSEYNPTETAVTVSGYHSPINLTIDGKAQLAMVKNVDIDPVHRTILNIEFQGISADEVVWAEAPITLIGLGNSEAEKLHFSILQVLESVEVKAKPADLPEALEIDIVNLASVGDNVTLGDIKLPKGVEFAEKDIDLGQVVANVYDPIAEAEAQAKADEEAAKAAAETAPATEEISATEAPATEEATKAE